MLADIDERSVLDDQLVYLQAYPTLTYVHACVVVARGAHCERASMLQSADWDGAFVEQLCSIRSTAIIFSTPPLLALVPSVVVYIANEPCTCKT